MGTRRLDVNLHLNRSEYTRSEKAAREASKQTAQQMISDADAAEKAKVEFIKRSNKQKIEELSKATKTDVELTREAEEEKKRLARETLAEEKRTASEKKREEDELAREIKRNSAEILTDDQAAQRARVELARRANREKVLSIVEASVAERDMLARNTAAVEAETTAMMGSVKQALAMGAAMAGVGSFASIMTAMSAEMDKIARYAQHTAEEILRIRGLTRELAALRGEMGTTGPTTAHVLGMQAQTLQSTEDVTAMESAGLGTGELAIGERDQKTGKLKGGATMTREEFDKAMVAAGKMQTLEGGNADAYGALTGQIALQSDHEMTGEEGQARLDRLFKIQQPGGFKNMSQAASEYAKISSLVQNKVVSSEEAMGTLSAFSTISPGESATMTNQFVRATKDSQIKARGPKVDPDLDTEKSYEYMKSIGADKIANPVAIGKAIAKDFAVQSARDKNFDAYRYLGLHGFGNQQDRLAIMAFAGLNNTGKLDKIEAAQNAPLEIGAPGEGVIDRRFRDRTSKDRFFQHRKAEVLDQLATAEEGEREEPWEIARRAAFARLKMLGGMEGKYEDWAPGTIFNENFSDVTHARPPGENSYRAINDMLTLNLQREATRLNVPIEDPRGVLSGRAAEKDLARRVESAGGDLSSGATRSMENAAASLEKSAARLERALNPRSPVPAPIPGRGAAIPARPN